MVLLGTEGSLRYRAIGACLSYHRKALLCQPHVVRLSPKTRSRAIRRLPVVEGGQARTTDTPQVSPAHEGRGAVAPLPLGFHRTSPDRLSLSRGHSSLCGTLAAPTSQEGIFDT